MSQADSSVDRILCMVNGAKVARCHSCAVTWNCDHHEGRRKGTKRLVAALLLNVLNFRQEFVDAYVDHILNKSVKDPFDEFKRGFIKVCDQDILEFFQPQELMDLMVGNTDYDWDVLEENTTYAGEYHKKHPTIVLFWSVFHEMNLHQRKAFLLFLTGSDRIPLAGMACIKMTILSLPHLTEDHYPEASTCFLQLMLPRYPTKERLQEKLLHAIQLNKGFGKT